MAFSRMATTVSMGTRAGEHPMLPGQTLQALGQHLQKARVGVDDGEPERRGVGGR
jgi:hypothetical protein